MTPIDTTVLKQLLAREELKNVSSSDVTLVALLTLDLYKGIIKQYNVKQHSEPTGNVL